MSSFAPFADSPFRIRTEGQEITLNFTRTGPTTGRISWNIPSPPAGCAAVGSTNSSQPNQAYNGIIITVDSASVTTATAPVNGTVYTADPTVDQNLFAGDRISTALVVGAFYGDTTTTFFDISGLTENAPYFVSGYAVDAQNRYHTEGVHAYSLEFSRSLKGSDDVAGYQTIEIAVAPANSTGLVPGELYTFQIDTTNIDGYYSTVENVKKVTFPEITINGVDAETFSDLITAINIGIAKIGNPPQSIEAPNTGSYYWNASLQQLFVWDGSQSVPVTAIVEPTDPTIRTVGDYWYNPTTKLLKRYDGTIWQPQTVISYFQDITTPSCDDIWFNGTNSFRRDGTVWHELTTRIQEIDPSLSLCPPCGTYWYDTTSAHLFNWNVVNSMWDSVAAIYWNINPSTPAMNSFWYDETHKVLNQWDVIWNPIAAIQSATTPSAPAINAYWFNTTTEILSQWNGLAWIQLPVLIWTIDPTVRESGDLWWDSVTNVLYTWDVLTSSWVTVLSFTQAATDPNLPPTLTTNDAWFVLSTSILRVWDGSQWVVATYISTLTDPMIPTLNEVWYNTTSHAWNFWNGVSWSALNPIDSSIEPDTITLPVGSFWVDTTTNQLKQWNGIAWISMLFSTVPPAPAIGMMWFNTVTNILMTWTKAGWVPAQPVAIVELNSDGNIIFTSTTVGSQSFVGIIDGTLFSTIIGALPPNPNLPDGPKINWPVPGTDGVNSTPQNEQPGVGDVLSADERRHMIENIMAQLGYPVVEVELSKYQLDFAISTAIQVFRNLSGMGYKRAFFFLTTNQNQQQYILTDKVVGFNKIVSVMDVYRMTSAFMGQTYGAGVFGQVALQQLYAMGTFDLLSYHIVSDYLDQLEILSATRVLSQWNEHTRTLDMLNTFYNNERVLVDAAIERSEQELLTDRHTQPWIQKYATATARKILAQIRGKYASLPGAGGGVTLNAMDLSARADAEIAECMLEIDNFTANNPEEWGLESTLIIG